MILGSTPVRCPAALWRTEVEKRGEAWCALRFQGRWKRTGGSSGVERAVHVALPHCGMTNQAAGIRGGGEVDQGNVILMVTIFELLM